MFNVSVLLYAFRAQSRLSLACASNKMLLVRNRRETRFTTFCNRRKPRNSITSMVYDNLLTL